MRAILPLFETVIVALEADGLLKTYMGGTVSAYPWAAPDDQAFPYITLSPVSMLNWSAGSFDGDDVLFRVAAHFSRGGAGDSNGIADVAKACERIQDVLTDRSGFNLNESPAEGESVVFDFLTGPVRVGTGTEKRLIKCQYVSSNIIAGLNDAAETAGRVPRVPASISGVVTFRAFVSPSN